ncbi:hypothetical protein FB567DRAFT_521291 [Paraphoma chrysanthemicola]|uniref:Uncharacterized protein n=1 Tax=Paraphoma chrysanthemicola TaxID=798071 RepID=A0A8K0W095_9PLEO|nr:hypothetical protein FB567DRAFT_521291 [Paraphoma chrysanthemicola]
MPPQVRTPTVEFRSFLHPPIRVPLRALQSFCRPGWLPSPHNLRAAGLPLQCGAQRRCLTLYKTARAATTLGQHKILPFDRYNVAPPTKSTHKIKLVGGKKGETVIAESISLQDVYENHIKPGQILYLAQDIPKPVAQQVKRLKETSVPNSHRTFGIFEPGKGVKVDPRKGKGIGALRVITLALSSPAAYFKLMIDKAYQFVEHGSPVEFAFALKRGNAGDNKHKLDPGDPEDWPWVHEHFPHLRPDFVLKSMPEGSMYSVEPVSNGRTVQFVIIKPSKIVPKPTDYTERLFNVKKAVTESIERGQQGELPSRFRQRLYDQGIRKYSPTSSTPTDLVREDGVLGTWDPSSTSPERYLSISRRPDAREARGLPVPNWAAKMAKKRADKPWTELSVMNKLTREGALFKSPKRGRKQTEDDEDTVGTQKEIVRSPRDFEPRSEPSRSPSKAMPWLLRGSGSRRRS